MSLIDPVCLQNPYLDDLFALKLCMWRECRGGGRVGMLAVGCVIRNRVNRDHQGYYAEVTKRLQFSSITAAGDPELIAWPLASDPSWVLAKSLAGDIINGTLSDITSGSTIYYAPQAIKSDRTIALPGGRSAPFPAGWNEAVLTYRAEIGNQLFFTENA